MPERRHGGPLRVAILGASLETGNWGVNALAWGSIRALLRSHPDASISLLDYGRASRTYTGVVDGDRVTCTLVNLRFSWKLALRNNVFRLIASALLRRLMHADVTRSGGVLGVVASQDAALALSGGDSFSDLYGMRRLLYVAAPQVLALLAGLPLVQLPQTYGPFRSKAGRWIARWILGRSSRVYARDLASMETARRLSGAQPGDPRFRLTCDVAFALEAIEPRQPAVSDLLVRDGQRPLVGFNVSGLLAAGGYRGANDYGLRTPYAATVAHAVGALVRERGCDVLLVPHVVTPGGVEDDVNAARVLVQSLPAEEGKHVRILDAELDQGERKHVIGACDAFIGSRMHACIAAISQGVPTVGLAYSDKFIGVLGALGAGADVVDLRYADEADVVRRCLALLDERRERRRALARVADDLCARALALFADLPMAGRPEACP